MERVIRVKCGSDLAVHIAKIYKKYGTEAILDYQHSTYHIVKMWKSDLPNHIELRLKEK